MEQEVDRWITWRGKHIPIKDGKIVNLKEKKYIGEKYTPENVNEYFKNIETYEQFEDFRKDYRNKAKTDPFIVPKKYVDSKNIREWVDFVSKEDDNTVSFRVLSEDKVYSRKAKSSIKNFVKNYKVHQE